MENVTISNLYKLNGMVYSRKFAIGYEDRDLTQIIYFDMLSLDTFNTIIAEGDLAEVDLITYNADIDRIVLYVDEVDIISLTLMLSSHHIKHKVYTIVN